MQKVKKNTIRVLFVALIAAVCFSLGLFAACGSNGGSGNGTGGGDKPSGEHTHIFVDTIVKPNCTEKGYTVHKCKCGYEYKDYETEALGHSFGSWRVITPETADRDGEEKRICTRENCDYFETRKIPKLDHTHEYTETVVEPTCTEKGYTLHKCECGEEYKDGETEALGHLFGEWKTITPATEDSEGLEQRVCARKNCGFKEERAIPVLSHTHHYITTIVEPTCTERGYTKYTCEKCGNSYNADYEKALGHNFGEWKEIKPATEEEDGLKERTCARCGETEEQAIPAKTHEHKFVDTVIEPTCTEKGYTIHKCKCGEQYEDSYVSALDHSYSTEWTTDKEATCSETGIKSHHCTRCEAKTDETEIPLAAHTFDDEICTVCGAVELIEATGLEYTLSEDKTYYIVSEMGDCTRKHFIIPATYNGLPVKEIGEAAFYKKSDIIQVVLPDSIEKIGNSAFYQCSALEEVAFGENLLTIGDSAFYQCYRIEKVAIPDKVTSIGNSAFAGWIALTDATIGNSVESIGNLAFENCNSLTSIIIPDSVTSIGDMAFRGCRSLTNIRIPDNVTNIGRDAFSYCGDGFIKYLKGVGYVDRWVVECDTSITKVELKADTVGVADSAFFWCSSLTSITIPDSVTSIGDGAFGNGCALTGVYITDIAAWCKIKFYDYDSNPLYYAHNLYLNNELVTDLVVLDRVTSIGDYAFRGCSGLTSVTIGNGVTSIGARAFSDCSKLTDINYNGSMEEWNKIEKGENWNSSTGNYVVHCTDGDIKKS